MNPFISKKRANLAIVDGRASDEIIKNLNSLGLKTIKTIKYEGVDESIAYHPDIVMHPINYRTLVIAPEVFDFYREELREYDLKLIQGETRLGKEYPEDIAYNVARIGNLALHNTKYTDPLLKYQLGKENIELINVRQGYTKCSLAVMGEDIGITSDWAIYNKLKQLGYKILMIRPGSIELEGQAYGFVGGAHGNLDKNKTFLSGSIDQHPNREEILNFIGENGVELEILSREKIRDLGTIMTFNT